MSDSRPNGRDEISIESSYSGSSLAPPKRDTGLGTASVMIAIVALFFLAVSILSLFLSFPKVLEFGSGPVAALLGFMALILGGLGIGKARREERSPFARKLSVAGAIIGGLGFLAAMAPTLLLILAMREARSQKLATNRLKMVGLALNNFHTTYKMLPEAGINESERKLMSELPRAPKTRKNIGFSWRVTILPFLDGSTRSTIDKLQLDKPWNAPHNAQLLGETPQFYLSPAYSDDHSKTVFLGVVSDSPGQLGPLGYSPPSNTAFRRVGRNTFGAFLNGRSNTIMVVEADADQAVPWAKPADLQYDPKSPRRGLGGLRPGGFLALLGDGSVRFIPHRVNDETLRNLFQRDGQLQIDWKRLKD